MLSSEKTGVFGMITTELVGFVEKIGIISHNIESVVQVIVGVATLWYMYHQNKKKGNG